MQAPAQATVTTPPAPKKDKPKQAKKPKAKPHVEAKPKEVKPKEEKPKEAKSEPDAVEDDPAPSRKPLDAFDKWWLTISQKYDLDENRKERFKFPYQAFRKGSLGIGITEEQVDEAVEIYIGIYSPHLLRPYYSLHKDSEGLMSISRSFSIMYGNHYQGLTRVKKGLGEYLRESDRPFELLLRFGTLIQQVKDTILCVIL